MDEQYKVYIKTDESARISEIHSSAFLVNVDSYTQIDEGAGDRFRHAQGNYLAKPLFDADGTHNYLYESGTVREATAAEKALERAAFPAPPPTLEQRLAAYESRITAEESRTAYIGMMTGVL